MNDNINDNTKRSTGGRPFENNSVDSFGLARVFAYIDGFNLYHQVQKLKNPHLKWVSLPALMSCFLAPNEVLQDVNFFTSRPEHIFDDGSKLIRHDNYSKVQNFLGAKIIEGKFKKRYINCKKCYHQGLECPSCKAQKWFEYDEKQTDTNLACAIIRDCFLYKPSRVIICSGDTDFIPVIKTIKECGLKTKIRFVMPPTTDKVPFEIRQALAEYYETEYTNNDAKIGISRINEVHLQQTKLPDIVDVNGEKITNPYL